MRYLKKFKMFFVINIILVQAFAFGAVTENVAPEKYVIGSRFCGLLGDFLGAISNIDWCYNEGNKLPVVYWGPGCLYIEDGFFNGTNNAWEYYFEPVSSSKYQPGDPLHSSYSAPSGFYIPCYDFSHIEEIRHKMYLVIQKYIKIKPYVLDEVEAFFSKNMKDCTVIGIHLRGTDKCLEAPKPIDPMVVIKKAQEFADSAKSAAPSKSIKFLVASDEMQLINFVKKNLQGTVICYENAERSTNGGPLHYNRPVNASGSGMKAKLGRDVLVEALLLSRCDYLVHTLSSISTAAILFNPKLLHHQFDGHAKI